MCLTLVCWRWFSPDLRRGFDHELAAADSPAHCRSKGDSPAVWRLETREECSGVIQSFPVLGNAEAAAKDGEYVLPSSNGFQVGEILGSGRGLRKKRQSVEERC